MRCNSTPLIRSLRFFANAQAIDIKQFQVERWTGDGQHVEEVNATVGSILVAHAADEAFVEQFPGANLTLRHLTHVLRGQERAASAGGAQMRKGVMIEDNPYTHGWCLNCSKVRPVRFSRIGNSDAPTHILCNECHFIIAALYKREHTTKGRAPIPPASS
jgi:hypothetical protein